MGDFPRRQRSESAFFGATIFIERGNRKEKTFMTTQSNNDIKVDSLELADILDMFISYRENLLIVGAPGVGKTCLVEQSCFRCNTDLEVFHPVISDPTDLKGMPALIKVEGASSEFLAKFVPFESLKRLLTATKPLVAFADDLGQAPPLVQAAWMQLTLARKLDDKPVSEFIIFLSASNRKEDKAGVQGILEPLKSRFVSIVELTVNPDAWCQWARNPQAILTQSNMSISTEMVDEYKKSIQKIHPYVRAFIKWRPKLLWDFTPSNDMTNTPSPRTIEHASRVLFMNPPGNIRMNLMAGAAGSAYATEFEGFLKVIRSLPKLSYIVKQPEKAPIPSEASAQYAIVEALLDNVNKVVIEPFFLYITRFPKEFQAWFYHQIKDQNQELIKNKAVTKWASKHGIN